MSETTQPYTINGEIERLKADIEKTREQTKQLLELPSTESLGTKYVDELLVRAMNVSILMTNERIEALTEVRKAVEAVRKRIENDDLTTDENDVIHAQNQAQICILQDILGVEKTAEGK